MQELARGIFHFGCNTFLIMNFHWKCEHTAFFPRSKWTMSLEQNVDDAITVTIKIWSVIHILSKVSIVPKLMQFKVTSLFRKCHSNWVFSSSSSVLWLLKLNCVCRAYCSTLKWLTALLLHAAHKMYISCAIQRFLVSYTTHSIGLMSSDRISEMPLIKWQNEMFVCTPGTQCSLTTLISFCVSLAIAAPQP